MTYNPFASEPITGTWEDHADYSKGGTDLPLAYGTPIPAPAAGTLQTSGGSGEYECGWVGTAGRRSILHLDSPLSRVSPRRSSPYEAEGPCVAIVLQHQSAFGTPGWHAEGTIIGDSGASANNDDWGGEVHLHWHGLDAAGNRLRIESFIGTSSTPAGGGGTPIPNKIGADDMPTIVNYSTALNGGNGKPMNGAIVSLSTAGVSYMTSKQWNEGGATVAAQYGGPILVNDQTFSRHLDVLGLSWALWEKAFAKPGSFQRAGTA